MDSVVRPLLLGVWEVLCVNLFCLIQLDNKYTQKRKMNEEKK